MELYQAEWCPHSHKVRQRLTELGLDVVLRQVAADPGDRAELERLAGTNEIPVLLVEGEGPKRGKDEILAYLARFPERTDIRQHRAKAREEVPTFDEVACRAALARRHIAKRLTPRVARDLAGPPPLETAGLRVL